MSMYFRKIVRKGSISIEAMMIVVVFLIIAGIVAYFFLMPSATSMMGTPRFTISAPVLTPTEFRIDIKNVGSVAISKIICSVIDGIDKKTTVGSFTIDVSANPVNRGEEINIYELIGDKSITYCVTGKGCANASGSVDFTKIVSGKPYIIKCKIEFANKETKTWTTTVTAS